MKVEFEIPEKLATQILFWMARHGEYDQSKTQAENVAAFYLGFDHSDLLWAVLLDE